MAGPDTEFGVQTSNLFSLLDDDAPAPAKKEAPVKKAPAPKTQFNRANERNERNDKRPERSQRGGGRGRGRGRGRGDARGRTFDRRSGTGRDKSQPKGGHGKGNWGTDKDDEADGRPNNRNRRDWRQGQQQQQSPEKAEKTEGDEAAPAGDAAEGDAKAAENAPAAEGEEEEQDKEPDTIGYDEFLAQKAAKAPEEDRARRVREAENDETQWEACAEITKEEDDEESFLGEGFKTNKKSKGKARSKKSKKLVSLDEFNVQTRSSGRGRGRGRGRGGNRDNNRSRNQGPSNVRVDDKTQFPSLS